MSDTPFSGVAEAIEILGEFAAQGSEVLGVAELDEQGTIVSANRPLVRHAGHSLAGTPVRELVAPGQRETFDQVFATARTDWQDRVFGLFPDAHGVPLDFTLALRATSAGWLLVAEPAQVTIVAVNQRLLALNDELARAQRRINQQNAELAQQNDRLLELDQMKDVLLANVSHDLRTPLTAILGYAELMLRRGNLAGKQAQAAAIIERNARRLLRLVNDLLLLAQVRAGHLRLERETVDLAALAADTVELARPLAQQGRLELALDVPPPGTAVVDADRLRLGQLLDNLLANAIKFTPAGGEVRVRVRAGEDAARLEVQDDGPGIPPEEQERLYDAFVRGRAATAPGTGLGLAIVRAVADAHGATIALDTGPGEGTRFTVTLGAAA